jgi:hypothetical protein
MKNQEYFFFVILLFCHASLIDSASFAAARVSFKQSKTCRSRIKIMYFYTLIIWKTLYSSLLVMVVKQI